MKQAPVSLHRQGSIKAEALPEKLMVSPDEGQTSHCPETTHGLASLLPVLPTTTGTGLVPQNPCRIWGKR